MADALNVPSVNAALRHARRASKWGVRHQSQGYLTRHEGKADNWIDRREEPYPSENAVVPKGQKVRHLRSNWAAEAAEIEAAIKSRIEVILGVEGFT
jgi:hypothetical protein